MKDRRGAECVQRPRGVLLPGAQVSEVARKHGATRCDPGILPVRIIEFLLHPLLRYANQAAPASVNFT